MVESTAGYTVEIWLAEDHLKGEEYAEYWNDVTEEQSKEWWVVDGEFARMERYLERQHLGGQLEQVIALAQSLGRPLRGSGIDLAAGNLWAIPRLIDHGAEHVYAVEFSRHRLLQLGPAVLRHRGVPQDAVTLCLGSFYDLRLPDDSLNFAFMSQAFHHASQPDVLLQEVRRVLRPGGIVLMIGEHIVEPSLVDRIGNAAASVVAHAPERLQKSVFGHRVPHRPLLRVDKPSPDPGIGDHYYYRTEYDSMFAGAGFTSRHVRRPRWQTQAFVLFQDQDGTP